MAPSKQALGDSGGEKTPFTLSWFQADGRKTGQGLKELMTGLNSKNFMWPQKT